MGCLLAFNLLEIAGASIQVAPLELAGASLVCNSPHFLHVSEIMADYRHCAPSFLADADNLVNVWVYGTYNELVFMGINQRTRGYHLVDTPLN